jgi:regulator of replication initiation timing
MTDLSIIVSEIELKLRKLIDEKNQLAQENKRLAEENKALDEENLALRRSASELQDKINKSTIVNALDNEGEVEEGRKLIKELVREIDRCVSILNSKE